MSRKSLIWPRRTRSEWDRPATDTRLLPQPFPKPVSLGRPRSSLRKSLVASAPSQSPVRNFPVPSYSRPIEAAYARSALLGVDADACGIAPRMISRSALPGVDADACVNSWMNARSALPGVERMPALTPQMTCSVPSLPCPGPSRERWQPPPPFPSRCPARDLSRPPRNSPPKRAPHPP